MKIWDSKTCQDKPVHEIKLRVHHNDSTYGNALNLTNNYLCDSMVDLTCENIEELLQLQYQVNKLVDYVIKPLKRG